MDNSRNIKERKLNERVPRNADECTNALSKALAATDIELYDATSIHIIKLIADFVPYST